MKKKPEIRKAIRDRVMNYVWKGAPIRAAAKLSGVKPQILRQYRRTHGIYDTRLRKLRSKYSLFHKLIKGG